MSRFDLALKRSFDLLASALGLLLLWPVMLVCALIALRDTGISGIYSQERVGRNGKLVRIHKIRTMRHVDAYAGNHITTENDPRVSPVGRRLRRYKLDELPQLWNVFVGDMSLVGPRPDVPGYADSLTGPERRVLALRPGITGPATIKYRDEEHLLACQSNPREYNDRVLYPDKVRLNLEYLDNWSLLTDIRYILMTVGLLKPPQALQTPPDALGTERS